MLESKVADVLRVEVGSMDTQTARHVCIARLARLMWLYNALSDNRLWRVLVVVCIFVQAVAHA